MAGFDEDLEVIDQRKAYLRRQEALAERSAVGDESGADAALNSGGTSAIWEG